MPTTGQLALLLLTIALLIGGGIVSILRLRRDSSALRVAEKSCLYWSILTAAGVLVWHGLAQRRWVPIGDNFDALVWLGMLLAAFVAYVQGTRPLAALEWFILPIVIVMLTAAAVLGRSGGFHPFHPAVAAAWADVHRISSFAGTAAFAVAAAAGATYVLAAARLRRKQPAVQSLGSLERLERLTLTAAVLGFALLTVGIVTGFFELLGRRGAATGASTPMTKVVLAISAWLVYGVVLNAPASPVLRGRRAAALSVVGFILMIGVIVTVESAR
jgi:ABC-type uncharacterized transport system permease subunit